MNKWIISDHHWGHANIIRFCNRPFRDLMMMDSYMVIKWNEVVKEGDIVYHLGDMFWSERSAIEILPLLNGEIHLILGNHDKNWIKTKKYDKLIKSPLNPDSNLVVEERDIVRIKDPIDAVLCHYPLMSWQSASYNVFHFHGHTHLNSCLSEGRRVNVSVENIGYIPVNLDIFKGFKSVEEVREKRRNIII